LLDSPRIFKAKNSGNDKVEHFLENINMQKFTTIAGTAAHLALVNVDTDMIIPKQFLKTIKRTGLGANLFDEMRFTPDGKEIPDFILNKKGYRNSVILVSGQNFGCGSSREHAPWALLDFGIRCIIAPSFADIFYNNCFKNGILPINLPEEQVKEIAASAEKNEEISVDLPTQKITLRNGKTYGFEVDSFRKHCLLNGLDDIGLTLQNEAKIGEYESLQRKATPWLFAG
jgi:3-isopropylmalate/(R)-2-methylmalate dehydratase small subunit